MITIEPADGRLSAWGKQADAKQIWWESAPDNLPRAGTTLDLDGKVIMALFDDGSTATVTDYCTFDPEDGSTVPVGATNVTVTAFYPARSGKTLKAPINLPVIRPVGLRIVTDASYKIKENFFKPSSAQYDSSKMPFDKSKLSVYVLYAQGSSDEPVFAEPCAKLGITPSYTYSPSSSVGSPENQGIGGKPNLIEDAEVYHSVDTPSIETFQYATKITATATVEGVSYSADTYVETIPIVALLYDDLPTVSGQAYSFYGSNITFEYADGSTEKPVPGLQDYGLSFSASAPSALSWHNPINYSASLFQDGEARELYIIRYNTINAPAYSYTHWHYVCADGYITWRQEDS